jgi:hypothetical protein
MKKYINPILSLGTAAALLGAIYFQTQQIDDLKRKLELQPIAGSDIQKAETIDSLQSELFVQQTIITRYEVALELLKEEDKKLKITATWKS